MNLLKVIGNDKTKQALELAMCAQDPVFWCNRWVWTFDPREKDSSIPFTLFSLQEDFFRWLEERELNREGGLVEKSRDMGITWCCAVYSLHGWLFKQGYSVGFGSRKLELVDKKGDPDTIFEKIRYPLERLPKWMVPKGFNDREHNSTAKLVNPTNNATITGEGGDEIGRGGRKTIYFVDESAFVEHPHKIEKSLSQTTNVRIDVSTPNGPGNPFARKRFSGVIPVFTFHWKNDPRKGIEWYDKQKRILDPVTLAQEVDIDYSASIEGICIPSIWVTAAVEVPLPVSGHNIAGLDIAEEGKNKNVFITRRGPVVSPVTTWANCNTTQTSYRAAAECTRQNIHTMHYDCIGVGAGVRGTLNSSETKLTFFPNAVNAGDSPSDDVWPDGKTSKERFLNLRAEWIWKLRCRFEKTYEYFELGVPHPFDEMISIPNDPTLRAQISSVLYFYTDTGKIKIESKADLKKRGIESPDHFDALYLSFGRAKASWKEVSNVLSPQRIENSSTFYSEFSDAGFNL